MKKIIKTVTSVFSFNKSRQISSGSAGLTYQSSSIQPQVPLGFKSRASSDYYMFSSR